MKTSEIPVSNSIEQAVLFNDTQEFSFYLSVENLISLHFSKLGQSLLYEVPFNDNSNIKYPSHIRPSLLLSYSTTFQNNTQEAGSASSKKNFHENGNNTTNTNNLLKQPTVINKQKTSFILSKYKNSVKEALRLRNTYSLYPYYPLEWVVNDKDNWFRTNSKLEYVHWPYISDQIDELSIKPNKKNNHCSHSDLFNNSLLKELNITVTSNNTTIIQSLDKFVTITIAPHYQIFKVKYPIYLGQFSNNLFKYTLSDNIYNDSYHGQYVYYYVIQEYSIKEIPEWCRYPLWLFQYCSNINLSIQNPIKNIEKRDMIIEKLPQTLLQSTEDSILQSPPDFEKPRSIKLLYTPEATYRLLSSNEIEIKINDDETIFRTFGNDMTYLSMYLPERHGQEDILKWKGMGRTFNSVITNHISYKRYPLQKFLHQALILYQSCGSSSTITNLLENRLKNSSNNNNIKYPYTHPKNDLPSHLYNYGLEENNMIPITPHLSSKVQEHLTINDTDFWAYADGRVRAVFSDRIIVSLMINSDQCEIIQHDGEKVIFRLSKVFGYEHYIKTTLDFAKWAFSTKTHRETEKLRKIQVKNIIRNEVRRNELFLTMTDYSRLRRQLKNDKFVLNLNELMNKKKIEKDELSDQDINYVKLSELLTNVQEKNKRFLSKTNDT